MRISRAARELFCIFIFLGASESSINNFFLSFSIDCHQSSEESSLSQQWQWKLGQRYNEKKFRENSENENNNKARIHRNENVASVLEDFSFNQ